MRECACGYTCGTEAALRRHLEQHKGSKLHASVEHAPHAPDARRACTHVGACGCSKYAVLGLTPPVSLVTLRETFKSLSLIWHPDRTSSEAWRRSHPGLGASDAAERFKKIRAAYEALLPLVEGVVLPRSRPLIEAVKAKDGVALRSLLEAIGPDAAELAELDEGGMDALGWACRIGDTAAVDLLLRACASEAAEAEAAPPRDGAPSAAVAATPACTAIAAEVERVPSLIAAAAGGSADVVSLLLERKAGGGGDGGGRVARALAQKESMLGHDALHSAADRGRAEVVAELLAARADVRAADRRGYTALGVAAFKGHAEVVRLLLDAGAEIEREMEGDTPLHLASRRGRVEAVRLLLERGARLDSRCLEQARKRDHAEVVELLQAAAARSRSR